MNTKQNQTINTSEYAHPEALVSAEWVGEHLNDPNVRIIESNEDVLLYDTGHIPGAVHVDWRKDLNDQTIRDYLDPEHFARVLKGVVLRQREVDPLIDHQLAEGWRLYRVDSIVRAILRAASFELMELSDVPPRVVISEYIDVAHAFFAGDEPRVVNGVLDQLARKLRPGELPDRD